MRNKNQVNNQMMCCCSGYMCGIMLSGVRLHPVFDKDRQMSVCNEETMENSVSLGSLFFLCLH